MEIRCPNCDTRFRVRSGQIREEGTKVRCSVCTFRFWAFPDGSVRSAVEDAAPPEGSAGGAEEGAAAPAPDRTEESSGRRKGRGAKTLRPPAPAGAVGRGAGLLLKLLVFLLVLGLLVELGYAFRNHWLAWPWARSAAQTALEWSGLEVELPVALRHYRAERVEARREPLRSGRHVTLLQGVLVNDAPFAQRPPQLEIQALGSDGEVRYRRMKRPGARLALEEPPDMRELGRRWEQARRDFPERLRSGQEVPFAVVLEDVPPGMQRFRIEMVP
ncbi:hypothetical protein AN478_11630 [Thiohalorhabdus denitrificans]|uniref:MJ0042 family finger-like domain-containing protein n=1 Tax=Thiohalorhabdus denitrificans TaxID=381306 RepID=A0A0P9CL58_9GAMM|nr:DUF3426 domain-containing protein [Thiohalorhabdus denitrificans]KPV39740.1 hypothetical protein AN478_11630 [Thiohalorhabdus denitrificans]SCX91453.1 MJ0042 family finger-like domain-containing protein [Thiohalorhabdus denitrificans]